MEGKLVRVIRGGSLGARTKEGDVGLVSFDRENGYFLLMVSSGADKSMGLRTSQEGMKFHWVVKADSVEVIE